MFSTAILNFETLVDLDRLLSSNVSMKSSKFGCATLAEVSFFSLVDGSNCSMEKQNFLFSHQLRPVFLFCPVTLSFEKHI